MYSARLRANRSNRFRLPLIPSPELCSSCLHSHEQQRLNLHTAVPISSSTISANPTERKPLSQDSRIILERLFCNSLTDDHAPLAVSQPSASLRLPHSRYFYTTNVSSYGYPLPLSRDLSETASTFSGPIGLHRHVASISENSKSRALRQTLQSVVRVCDTHRLAETDHEKNARFRKAFDVKEYYIDGRSLDPHNKPMEAAMKSTSHTKYVIVKETSSSSPEYSKITKRWNKKRSDRLEASSRKKRSKKRKLLKEVLACKKRNKKKRSKNRSRAKSRTTREKHKKHIHRCYDLESDTSESSMELTNHHERMGLDPCGDKDNSKVIQRMKNHKKRSHKMMNESRLHIQKECNDTKDVAPKSCQHSSHHRSASISLKCKGQFTIHKASEGHCNCSLPTYNSPSTASGMNRSGYNGLSQCCSFDMRPSGQSDSATCLNAHCSLIQSLDTRAKQFDLPVSSILEQTAIQKNKTHKISGQTFINTKEHEANIIGSSGVQEETNIALHQISSQEPNSRSENNSPPIQRYQSSLCSNRSPSPHYCPHHNLNQAVAHITSDHESIPVTIHKHKSSSSPLIHSPLLISNKSYETYFSSSSNGTREQRIGESTGQALHLMSMKNPKLQLNDVGKTVEVNPADKMEPISHKMQKKKHIYVGNSSRDNYSSQGYNSSTSSSSKFSSTSSTYRLSSKKKTHSSLFSVCGTNSQPPYCDDTLSRSPSITTIPLPPAEPLKTDNPPLPLAVDSRWESCSSARNHLSRINTNNGALSPPGASHSPIKKRIGTMSRSMSHSYSRSMSSDLRSHSTSRSGSYDSQPQQTGGTNRRSRSPSIPRRYGSPSFLDKRRITSARKRPIPYHRPSPPSSLSSWSNCSATRSSWSRSRSRGRASTSSSSDKRSFSSSNDSDHHHHDRNSSHSRSSSSESSVSSA